MFYILHFTFVIIAWLLNYYYYSKFQLFQLHQLQKHLLQLHHLPRFQEHIQLQVQCPSMANLLILTYYKQTKNVLIQVLYLFSISVPVVKPTEPEEHVKGMSTGIIVSSVFGVVVALGVIGFVFIRIIKSRNSEGILLDNDQQI